MGQPLAFGGNVATEDYLEHQKQQKQLEPNKQYVVGFAFNESFSSVLLIRKNRPASQSGKLNGPGGKVEDCDHEAAREHTDSSVLAIQVAMAREFLEETGLHTSPDQWTPFAEFNDRSGWKIFFMFTTCNIWDCKRTTDEQVVPFRLGYLHTKGFNLMPNLNWLIPMALTKHSKLPITDFPDSAKLFVVTEL